MPLITCNECRNQISATAKVCPQCGAKGRALNGSKRLRTIGKVTLALFGLSVVGSTINSLINPPHVPTPAEQAQAALVEKRNVNIATYARSLRATLRNPQSLEIERVTANGDGARVCFQYRAQNGFGGYNREIIAFAPNGGSRDNEIVRVLCRDKDMEDVTEAADWVIRTLG